MNPHCIPKERKRKRHASATKQAETQKTYLWDDSSLNRECPELQPPTAIGANVLRNAAADEVLLPVR